MNKKMLIALGALMLTTTASAQQYKTDKNGLVLEKSMLPEMPAIPTPEPIGSVKMGDSKTFEEVQLNIPITKGPFKPNWKSIEANYPGTPQWLRDAKFGIWVHFGPQSAGESGDWYARNLYKEGHKAYKNHLERY